MSGLAERLREVLAPVASGEAVLGLAAVLDHPSEPTAVWTPRALEREPGFLAYSITKSFTAVLVLKLAEEGRLALDDPLARWLPQLPGAERISLRALLSHTAGLRDYGGLAAYHEAVRRSPGEPWSPARFAAETYEQGLLAEPGSRFAYSNPGYMLLKQVVEEIGGQSYASAIETRITRPLALRRTFVAERPEDLAALARAPSRLLSLDGSLRDVRDTYHPGWVSHGVVASTPSEIVRFYSALARGELLAPVSLDAMTCFLPVPDAPPRWRRPSYGLGLMADGASPWGVIWGHGGGGPGYQASAFHARTLEGRAVTVCAMCASEDDALADRLVFAAFDRLRAA